MISSLNNGFKRIPCIHLDLNCIFRRNAVFHRVPKRIVPKTKQAKTKVGTESQIDPRKADHSSNLSEDIFTLNSGDNSLKYKKVKDTDDIFSSTMTMVKSSKQREKKNVILLEGKRLIRDALDANVQIKSIFFSQKEAVEGLDLSSVPDGKIYKVFYKQMNIWSDLSTPPGIMAICKKPDLKDLHLKTDNSLPVNIICDNIRDPGNLGAIIRTACAAGCKLVLTTSGCVDTWNSKVIRGGSGAHFRIPIYSSVRWPYIRNYLPETFNMIIADNNNNNNTNNYEFNCDSAPLTDVKRSSEIEIEPSGLIRDDSYIDDEKLKFYKDTDLPHAYYPDVKIFTERETVLIIGGENEGVSASAHKLAYDFEGRKLTIPLLNGVESLNTATASAIIIFELKRIYQNRSNLK